MADKHTHAHGMTTRVVCCSRTGQTWLLADRLAPAGAAPLAAAA